MPDKLSSLLRGSKSSLVNVNIDYDSVITSLPFLNRTTCPAISHLQVAGFIVQNAMASRIYLLKRRIRVGFIGRSMWPTDRV